MTGVAIRCKQRCAASGRFIVDLERISRRRDFLGEIGLVLYISELEVATLAVQWRAQPERGE